MEVRPEILWIIIGTSIVTFIPRVLPLVVLSKIQLPEWGLRWLHYIPITVMAALLSQELLSPESLEWNKLWAAIPAFLIAFLTRSLLATVLVGIVAVMMLRMTV